MSFYQSLLEKINSLEHLIEEEKLRDAHLPWYLKSSFGGKTFLPLSVYSEKIFNKLSLHFYKFLLALTRVVMIIKGTPTSNFNVFTQAGKEGVYICNYSYCYYKGYHKNTKWKFITALVAATTLVSLIVALVFPGKPYSKAASRTWTQTDWSGLEDAGAYPVDPTNLTNWDQYAAGGKDANVDVSTVGEAKLSTVADATPETETADTDFNGKSTTDNTFAGGSSSSTEVVSNTVKISLSGSRPSAPADSGTNNGGADLTPANGSTISGNYYNVGTFTITAGYTVYVPTGSVLQIKANAINIAGTLNGDAKGFAGGAPSGNSGTNTGSYGGTGGVGGTGGNSGGTSVGTTRGTQSDNDIELGGGAGSGGAGGGGGAAGTGGAAGGGAVYLYASGSVTIGGSISVSGGAGGNGGTGADENAGAGSCTNSAGVGGGGGAGGSGGGILVNGESVTITGILNADSGIGGNGGAGGHSYDNEFDCGYASSGNGGNIGGSGRIKIFANSTPTTAGATITATGYHTSGEVGACSGSDCPNYSVCNVGSIHCATLSYAASGTFTSRVFDVGANQNFGKITWTDDSASVANGSSVAMEVRSGNLNPPTDGTWTSVTNGGSLYGFNNKQYIQYRATLTSTTSGASATPTLSEVKIYYESTWNNAAISSTDVKITQYESGGDCLLVGDVCDESQSFCEGVCQEVWVPNFYYYSSGTFTSQIIDTGQINSSWGLAEWSAATDVPAAAGLSMTLKVRSCNDSACSGEIAFSGIAQSITMTDGAGSSALSSLSSMVSGDRYVQYQATLNSSADGLSTPTFADLTINSSSYPSSQALTSSAYNSGNTSTMVNSIAWNPVSASQPANTAVKFQLRTAPDNGANAPDWTNGSKWCGPTTCAATAGNTDYSSEYYTAGATLNSAHSLNADDQWIQYRVWLESTDGAGTPTLTDVSFSYVMNTPTCIGTVPGTCSGANKHSFTPSQSSAGTISIASYPLSDTEETGTASSETTDKDLGTVNVQFFYDIGVTANNGGAITNSAASITISDASLFPAKGYIMLANSSDSNVANQEVLYYGGKTGNTLNTISRGKWPGTTDTPSVTYQTLAFSHTDGALTTVWLWAKGGGSGATGSGNKTGISVTPTTISDTTTLTPATDLASSAYLSTARVRIAANDGNAGNSVGTADSGTFTLDTTVPAYTTYASKLDSNATPAITNNISATAGSTATYMRFSGSDITALTCADSSTAWEAYATTKAWTLSPDASGVSTVYWQFKDDNCNMISGSSATPATPVNMQITDISAVPAAKYRDIIWWDVVPDPGNFSQYNVYRCSQSPAESAVKCNDSANYSVLSTIANRATNYCFDEGDGNCADNALGSLDPVTKYFYKVTAEDVNGVSLYSSIVSAIPDGSIIGEAVTDVDPPVLSVAPADSGTTQTGTTITWTTDEPSYSLVKYGTSSSNLDLIAGNATESVLTHSVALSALSSGTLYYYQILSADAAGNLLKSPTTPPTGLYTFTTLADSAAPAMVGTPSVIAGQTSVTVSWTTSEASTSQVKYIAAADNTIDPANGTSTAVQSELVTSHIVIITGLTADTIYNYQILSNDASSNNLTYQSAAPFGQFNTATPADMDAPTLDVAPADSGTTQTGTAITWTTNENSYSVVKYGTNQNALDLTAGTVTDSVTSHSVAISDLTAGTLYYYQIFSADSSGNLLKSPATPPTGLYTFTTSSDSTAPSLVGTPAVTAGRDSATISWVTDEASSTRFKYVIAVDNTTAPATFTALQSEFVTNHYVILTGLTASTTYNFQVISADASSNTLTSPSASPYLQFSTQWDRADATAPVITFTEASQGPSLANASLADSTASATFSADENAFFSIVYEASPTAPSSYSKETGYPSLITSPATYAVPIEGLIANTKYYYKLQARDLFGNVGESGPYFFITTHDDTAPSAIIDLAGTAASSSSATLTWAAPGDNAAAGTASSYDIRYSTSLIDAASWAAATPAADEPLPAVSTTSQSMTVTGLASSTTYYFALKTSDEVPNTSDLSNVISVDIPAQLDITPPVISAVVLGAVTANTAVISWTTDKDSSSLIDFGTTASYGSTQGSSSVSSKTHSVTLLGLAPNTGYYYRLKSIDSSGNIGFKEDASYLFTTDVDPAAGTLPVISSVQSSGVTASSAQITWTTTVASDSTVGYSLDTNYAYEAGSAADVTSHTVTLSSLAPSSTYYFRVKSRNGNQLATDNNNGTGFSFTTSAGTDSVPPNISSVQATAITANRATITWTTNENSNSYVEFGTALNAYTSVQGNPGDSLISHSVQLVSLTPSTSYYFQVKSTDSAGNKGIDNNSNLGYTFSTTTGAAVDCPAVGRSCPVQETLSCPVVDTTSPVISAIKVSDITFNTATITWTTDESSSSAVSYDIYSYDVKGGFTFASSKPKDSTKSHSVTLNALDSASVYYFRVLSTDARGNTAESAEQSFKTPAISESKDKGAATADSLKKEFESIAKTLIKDNLATEENVKDLLSRITDPPAIIGAEGPAVKDIKPYGATIIWQTDRKSNSIVRFMADGKNINPLAKLINWEERGKSSEFGTDHEVILLGLAPSTEYSFQAQSQDILGNTSSSGIKTFTTSGSSSIFNVLVNDLNLTSAKITWETANLSTSSLEYGATSDYGNYLENKDEKVKNHSISLFNLSPSSVFHFRVRSTEESGTILTSDDYSFSTPSLPQITKYTLGEVKDNSIAFTWTSNIPIDSGVRYTNTENNEAKNITKEEKTTDHSLTIEGLEAGKTYKIEIQGRDEAGNLAAIPSFDVQTGMDTVPPEISQVRSQSAVLTTAEDKVQSIISWKTNELASTKVIWDKGGTTGDTFANESALDTNLTTNHIVILTQFNPGSVYRFRVVSADKFGNTTASSDYTILAPVKRQSIIQMIINQFENIFGWTKGIGR